MVSLSTVVVLFAVASGIYLSQMRRVNLPKHLLHHRAELVPGMIPPDMGDDLLDLMKEMKEIPSNANDLKFYKTQHEHIGEAVPREKDGSCSHPYMVPSIDGTQCILAGRIDIGRHFIKYGGVQGLKEPFEVSLSRLQSFGRFIFNYSSYEVLDKMLSSPSFQSAARRVCPPDQQYLDPFQFNYIVQVPGQTVALHLDGVYFWGATRFQIPQWLLAVMKFSGLFEDRYINQVQVVGYIHRWDHEGRDGSFVYWNKEGDAPEVIAPVALAGSTVDGSKVVHAAKVYMKHVRPPLLDKSRENRLVYQGNDVWHLISDNDVLKEYTTDDLRISVVYRARCFKDEADRQRFHSQTDEDTLPLDTILNTLQADLVKRGRLSAGQNISRIDLALKLLDEYIAYPLPVESLVPINYCLITKYLPFTKPLLQYIC